YDYRVPFPPGGDHWYEPITETTHDVSAMQWSQRRLNYTGGPGFGIPSDVEDCGKTLASCRTTVYTYASNGQLLRTAHPDGSWEEESFGPCGFRTTLNESGLAHSTFNYDSLCRLVEDSTDGGTLTTHYDGFNRPWQKLRATGWRLGTDSPLQEVTTTYFDDTYACEPSGLAYECEDEDFDRPQVAIVKHDRLEESFFDGFGRLTRTQSCTADTSSDSSTVGTRRYVRCDPAQEILVTTDRFYGQDGLLKSEILGRRLFLGLVPAFASKGYLYDGAGRIVAEQRPSPTSKFASWDTWGWVHGPSFSEETDPHGNVTLHTRGVLTTHRLFNGDWRSTQTMNVLGDPVLVEERIGDSTSPDVRETEYFYDERHRLIRRSVIGAIDVLDAMDTPTTATYTHLVTGYDGADRVVSQVLPSGQVQEFTYDALGRVLSERLGGVTLKNITYTAGSSSTPTIETQTDEAGHTTSTLSDGLGRVAERWSGALVNRYTYDDLGNVTDVEDPNGHLTTSTYDTLGRLQSQQSPSGATQWHSYDASGRLYTVTDDDGVTLTHGYMFDGSRAQERLGAWVLHAWAYDALGRTTEHTRDGVTRTMTYSPEGHMQTVSYGAVSEMYDYDYEGRVIREERSPVSGSTAVTVHTYNRMGWKTKTTDALLGETWYHHDQGGRLRKVVDPEGRATITRYDNQGRVVEKERVGLVTQHKAYLTGASFQGLTDLRELRTYDSEDLARGVYTASYTDSSGRSVGSVLRDGTEVLHTYSGTQLTGTQWFDTLGTVFKEEQRSYDLYGRLEQIDGPATPAELSAGKNPYRILGYTAADRLSSAELPDDTITLTFGAQGEVLHKRYSGMEESFVYHPTLKRLELRELTAVSGAGPARTWALGYDGVGHLTSLTIDEPGKATVRRGSSGHDALGNPT
ncbi:MAG: hypothetical protein AAFX99_26585, partial [Myxococcota bacterium]